MPSSSQGKPTARMAAFLEAGGAGGAERILLAYLAALKGLGWRVHTIIGGELSEVNRAKFALWGPGLEFTTVPWHRRTAYRIPVVLPSLDMPLVRGLRKALLRLRSR